MPSQGCEGEIHAGLAFSVTMCLRLDVEKECYRPGRLETGGSFTLSFPQKSAAFLSTAVYLFYIKEARAMITEKGLLLSNSSIC